jgi:hypothetical protein
MSKKSRTVKHAPAEPAQSARIGNADPRDTTVAIARGPADVVAVIPYLLGFEPHESIVVVSLVGPRRRLGPIIRADLVDPLAHDGVEPSATDLAVDQICDLVAVHRWDPVLAVAFTERRSVADHVMKSMTMRLEADGVEVTEAIGASRDRWWSYTCGDGSCCPRAGTPFDPTASPLAATAVAAGMTKASSRDGLRALVAPASEALRAEAGLIADKALTEQAESQAARWNVSDIERVLDAALGNEALDLDTIATLLAMVQSIELRDAAWLKITRATAAAHWAMWQQVMGAAPDRLLAPAGALAGFAAWLAGLGVVASHAADRVCEVAPSYSMIQLLRRALELGVNPDVWDR